MATGTAAMATSLDGFHARATAQRADELARAFFAAVSAGDHERIDAVAARSFLSYDTHGTRSRTGFKQYVSGLRRSFSGLRFEVHENVGVLAEGDLVALRTIVTEGYIQNSGWTPDGRSAFASAIAVSRGAMPDGRALQTHMVAENNRLASRSVWDGTITASGRPADFTTLDFFRIEDGLIAEHWESVDWVRAYQAFGLLPDDVRDA
jgi:predicted SnoaL-like aldol condensation-catalyzing enzyme